MNHLHFMIVSHDKVFIRSICQQVIDLDELETNMSESEKKKRQNLKERLISDPTRVITLANLISLLRAFSAIPIIYSMANPDWNWITGI